MSQFDRYTTSEYIDALRGFLGIKKSGFLYEYGFASASAPKRRGRKRLYSMEPVKDLEKKVNERAALAESKSSTLADRFSIARDYQGTTDAWLATQLRLSRETVRRWGENISKPSENDLARVADLLQVPYAWLAYGGEEHLSANSPIGVRVGNEAETYKMKLREMVLNVLEKTPDDSTNEYMVTYIEWFIFNTPEMSLIARRAGGRWQLCEPNHVIKYPLVFAPWVPIKEHGLSKRFWTDDVETIIQEELAANDSIYGAWKKIAKRCAERGLDPEQYPQKISLYKRVENERKRIDKFGINLNDAIATAIEHVYSEAA